MRACQTGLMGLQERGRSGFAAGLLIVLLTLGPGPDVSADSAQSGKTGLIDEAAAIEQTIRGQIDSFRSNNAKAAFSAAAPAIQDRFGTAERFIAMVRQGYPVVVDPTSIEFQPLIKGVNGSRVQPVLMSDAQGMLWMVTYSLTRDARGQWRINGVQQKRTNSNVI